MPVEIDGFATLGAIARRPDLFAAAKAEVIKSARAVVVKQLKDRSLSWDQLKSVATTIKEDAFHLICDALSDADIKALLTKIDKLNTTIKSASASEQRKHLADLALNGVQPAQKAVAPVKEAKVKAVKPKVERAGSSKAMKATRKR